MLPSRKKWLWLCCCLLFAVVVIVVVVPSVVVTRNNRNSAQQQESSTGGSNNGGENGGQGGENSGQGGENGGQGSGNGPTTDNTPTEPPPSYAKAVSSYANYTRVQTYHDLANKDRIFIIGDVHGCAGELKELVQKINYNKDRDQIILAGDLVYRGPDNVGVIRYAKEINALCVRGNHDDIVIRFKTYELQHGLDAMQDEKETMPEGDVEDPLKFGDDHMGIVKNMTQEDYDYLVSCPLVLELPSLNNSRVVHGGLDPQIKNPVNNDPYWVVNMRNIDDGVPERTHSDGKHWTKYWSEAQHKNFTAPINVYYGHDAGRGLDLETETFGTDSACVYGHQLTALEMKTHQVTQVDCQDYDSMDL
ncbi:Metallo-dependent phosphatase-like protein [Fennellomyces sp. T-0311]|nr:Metallo-dependent phosphatase-like protein [Fennellomyces sp. T-0311]